VRDKFKQSFGTDWVSFLNNISLRLYHESIVNKLTPESNSYFSLYGDLLSIALFQNNLINANCMMQKIINELQSNDKWTFLADIFDSCGYKFESNMCWARYYVLNEHYEEAIEKADWLLKISNDFETKMLSIYARMGLSRSVKDFLFGRNTVEINVDKCIEIYESFSDNEKQQIHIQDIILEIYYLKDDINKVLELATNFNIKSGIWYTQAFIKQALERIKKPEEIIEVIDKNHFENTETLELLHHINDWFFKLKLESESVWKSDSTFNTLSNLYERWNKFLTDFHNYRSFWELGRLKQLEGLWNLNKESIKGVDDLKKAIDLWKVSLSLTHDNKPPFRTLLKRHENLSREKIEETLRRCLKLIKSQEKRDYNEKN